MDIPGGSLQDIGRDRLCNSKVSNVSSLMEAQGWVPFASVNSQVFLLSQSGYLGIPLLAKLPTSVLGCSTKNVYSA